MKKARIIPVLLLRGNGLYKTRKFKKPIYIGDPINAVKIFSEKEVDEIILLDIDATVKKKSSQNKQLTVLSEAYYLPSLPLKTATWSSMHLGARTWPPS